MCKIGKWISLQTCEDAIVPFDVVITMPNGTEEKVQVSKHWTLTNLRDHLLIIEMHEIQDATIVLHGRKVRLHF